MKLAGNWRAETILPVPFMVGNTFNELKNKDRNTTEQEISSQNNYVLLTQVRLEVHC
jgi:hypothetical protein